LPVALLFAGRRGPVALLRLPPRPGPRRLPARLAAIALPRSSWLKALLTSFEQTQSRPRSARQPFSRAALLIFGMACSTLGGAQGRSLLPEAPAPEGIALLSGAQQIFGSIRDNNSIAKMRCLRALPLLSGVLFFPAVGGAVVIPAGQSPIVSLKSVQVGWWPVTATHHWRSGPRWPAKTAPSPAATNISNGFIKCCPMFRMRTGAPLDRTLLD
jgi:hypothetical protein